MSSPLNKAGFRSNRNNSRPWRSPRWKFEGEVATPHPLDMMRWWIPRNGLGQYQTDEQGNYTVRRANTTGCLGTINMDSAATRIPSLIVGKGAPGRKRRTRPKKKLSHENLAHRTPKNAGIETERLTVQAMIARYRSLMKRIKTHRKPRQSWKDEVVRLVLILSQRCTPQEWALIEGK